MVMRPFRNIPLSKQKSNFSFSRNVSTNNLNNNNNNNFQFFNPSYLSPKDLIKLDEISFNNNSKNKNNKNNNNFLKYITPALSVTKNYIIFNNKLRDHNNINNSNNNNDNNDNNDKNYNLIFNNNDYKILLRKLNHKNNKNGHLNITIDSVNENHTILNIRRANSNNIKQILISNKSLVSKRNYSTNNLEKDFNNLNLNEDIKEDINEIKVKKCVKFDNNNNTNINSIDEALDTFLYNDPVKSQELLIDNLMNLGKFNEILPLFIRMRNNEILPSIEIYNKVLKSIELRETDESIEIKLTHLLNTYSDMLSNNIKPNNLTYELIIENLVKGSIKSYNLLNFKNGYEFFKIAFELFLINHKNSNNNSSIIFKNNYLYINLLNCLNFYKIKDLINPIDLFNLIDSKILSKNKIEFYIQLIKFSTLFKDLEFIENLYNNQIKSNLKLLKDSNLIYQELIQAYNHCNKFEKSSLLLDSIINKLPNKDSVNSQNLISNYLSIFIKSQCLIDPYLSFKLLYKFNKINWLPNIQIESLILLSFSFLRLNDLEMSLKVWNYLIIRNDFDLNFNNLLNGKNSNEYLIYISNFHNQLYLSILNTGDKNLILKSLREILIKNSIILDDSILINFIKYLNLINENDLIIKLILNQGYKRIVKNSLSSSSSSISLNNYLSLIIDFLSTENIIKLFNTKFFKKVVEEYRLINDNIYGILKIYQILLNNFKNLDNSIKNNLKYYSKVLDYEFNDVDNCYVKIPQELINFKLKLKDLV